MDLSDLRREYETAGLAEGDLDPDPVQQFDTWFRAATDAGLDLPNTAVLATADAGGYPSARAVLLKGYDSDGFVFYTNYDSAKGRDLAVNPNAAMCFVWLPLHRQVRVQGIVLKVASELSDEYFASRPRGSQISAAASAQSAVLAGRDELEEAATAIENASDGSPIPRPARWGGYRLIPHLIEFWQGRGNRRHDRLRYRRDADAWAVERLSP